MKWQSFVIPIVCFSSVLFAAFAIEDFGVRAAICVAIIAVSIPAHFLWWWLVRSRQEHSETPEKTEQLKKPWTFSLRTLLIVAMFAPAMVAGFYLGIRLVWIVSNLAPTFDAPFADGDNPNAVRFKAQGGESHHEHMTIFVNTQRIIEFPYAIAQFTPAEQTGVRVTKRYWGNSVQVTALQTGEAQLIVFDSYGDQRTIDISVIDK